LLNGSFHKAFDERRSALASATSACKHHFFAKYAQDLSQSDHIPVGETVTSGTLGPIKVTTWNVLEFPCLGSREPVFDGVRPVCDMVLKGLRRKDAECMNILLEAVSSDVVINHHTRRVLSFVQDEMTHCGTDVLLLQEVNERVRDSILNMCISKGWSAHFSAKNNDAKHCDSMTAIITKHAFDEVAEIEVQRNSKVRHFAAARLGSTWVVCVHLPLSSVPKEKEDLSGSFGSYSLKVLQQLWHRFGSAGSLGNEGAVYAGGDWNAPIRNTIKLATAHPPEGCRRISLFAPQGPTTLCDFLDTDDCSPIDGFFSLG
jgi:hypothetical protein